MFGELESWPAYFNFAKRIGRGKALAELATNESWRRKQKRQYEKIANGKSDKSIPLSYGLRESISRKIVTEGKHLDEPVTVWWYLFEQTVFTTQDKYPDSPITHLFLFLATLKNRKFDSEEALMWMLCAYLEWIYLELFLVQRIDEHNRCDSFFVAMEKWIPQSEGGCLRTTRNRVLNEIFDSRDDRNFRHLLGEPHWHDATTKRRKLKVEHAIIELKRRSVPITPVLDDYRYRALFSFVNFFEWMQMDMLSNNIPAIYIERSFSRLPEVASTFNNEIYKYFLDNNV